jgi:cell division protein FtsL
VEATRVRGGRPIPAHRRHGPAPDRPLRLALWTTAVLTVGTIFGAAAFHVLLVQSQFRLDGLENQAGVEQQHYEQLRLEVARLAAPERIVAAAQQRLGMVVPPDVAYLMAPTPTGSEPASASVAGEWSEVKPHLAARP